MFFILLAVSAFAVLATAVVIVAILVQYMHRIWRRTHPEQKFKRAIIIAVAIALIASPYITIKIVERIALLARVPEPLGVAAVEYRLEEYWGTGFLPGDNETGFVVYRLTASSAEWARGEGIKLGGKLAGDAAEWRPTPVGEAGDRDLWHHYDDDPQMMSVRRPEQHPPTIIEFLEKYGFAIPIEGGRDAEADQAIQTKGSFYSYGRGGSVTIVDPARGKVYFAYAG